MIKLTSAGISMDKGINLPIIKQQFKLFEATLAIDKGTIPPKNYFKERIQTAAIAVGPTSPDMILLQII